MTWKEFKQQVENGGVTDEMDLWYIDVSSGTMHHDTVHVCPQEKEGPNEGGFTIS